MVVPMPIYILGAGGHAREIAHLLRACRDAGAAWDIRGHIAPEFPRHTEPSLFPYLGSDEWLLAQPGPFAVAIAIGSPMIVRRLSDRLKVRSDIEFPTLIHPTVRYEPELMRIGAGAVLCAGCILTVNVAVGAWSQLNIGCTVSHDTVIGECCIVSPGAHLLGEVTLEDEVFVGAGATIKQGVRIGRGAVIGAQSFVNKNVEPGVTVVGVPAKPLERKS